jgi:hypothetical protein
MSKILKIAFFLFLMPLLSLEGNAQGKNDTILLGAVQIGADIYPMFFGPEVEIITSYLDPKKRDEMRRLRYNVYKVYPYAVTAAFVLDKVDKETSIRTKKKDRKAYLKQVESEMNDKFKDQLKNLSMTQGQILVKLINRQTGRDCYSVIKEIKGGLNARIYQTAAFFFDNNLKAQYDPYGKDRDIEMIVQEIESKNYYQRRRTHCHVIAACGNIGIKRR